MANARAFDTAILVSGDRDFVETVRSVKNSGLRVEVVSWRGAISAELGAESSLPVVFVDDIRGKIELLSAPDIEAEKLAAGDQ